MTYTPARVNDAVATPELKRTLAVPPLGEEIVDHVIDGGDNIALPNWSNPLIAICFDVVLVTTGTDGSTTFPSGVDTVSDVSTWATLNVTFDRIEPEVARRL
jgi:hypothetical protein